MTPDSVSRRSPITSSVRASLAAEARRFLQDLYRLDADQVTALASVEILWKRGRRRRMAYYRPTHPRSGRQRYISIAIPPGSETRWVIYDRVHAQLTTPPGGIRVPIRLRLVLTLVHEYTHAIQDGVCGGKKRRFLEAEPTKNEIEYVRRHEPGIAAQLVPSRRRRTRSPHDSAESSSEPSLPAKGLLRRLLRGRPRSR